MTESPEELAAVEQLLAESDALRAWLARLDTAPASAPDAVRDRVRRDYQARLDQITAGLRAHGDVISSKLREDRAEHAGLLERANAAREALAEAELRHLVGEYDEDRFNSERTRHASDIESFDLGLSAVAERVARLDEVFAMIVRGPRPSDVELEPPLGAEPVQPEVHVISEVDAELTAIADLSPDADPDDVLAIFDEHRGDARKAGAPDTGPLSFRPSGTVSESQRPSPPQGGARSFDTAPPLGHPSGRRSATICSSRRAHPAGIVTTGSSDHRACRDGSTV